MRDIRLLLEDPNSEVLLGAGDDAHVGRLLGQGVKLPGGTDAPRAVQLRYVWVIASDKLRYVSTRRDTDRAADVLTLE